MRVGLLPVPLSMTCVSEGFLIPEAYPRGSVGWLRRGWICPAAEGVQA